MNIFLILLLLALKQSKEKKLSLSSLNIDFKENYKIKNKIMDWKKYENYFKILIYCLEENINVEKEKELLNKLYQKHGLLWTAFDPEVKKII